MLADIVDFQMIRLLGKQCLQIRVMIVLLYVNRHDTSMDKGEHSMSLGQLKFKMV